MSKTSETSENDFPSASVSPRRRPVFLGAPSAGGGLLGLPDFRVNDLFSIPSKTLAGENFNRRANVGVAKTRMRRALPCFVAAKLEKLRKSLVKINPEMIRGLIFPQPAAI